MADSGFGKKSPKCSKCSQKEVLCVCSCKSRLSPMSVVEMSQTSSISSSVVSISSERKKEQASKDNASEKDLVNI